MRKVYFFLSLSLISTGLCFNPAISSASESERWVIPQKGQVEKKEEDINNNDLLNAVRAGRPQNVDTRMTIVNLLLDVKSEKISPEDFYQKVSQLPMPDGLELRHVLMEVKKDVGNYLGENGIKKIFGQIYDSGATFVEANILSHRKAVVMRTIKEAIMIYRKQMKTAGDFSLYYGEVGGWPNESFQELKFAGDIDFNFLSGDLDAAMELKKIYDKLIKKRYNGRSPEEMDIPCTVHGMATAEVYVGKYGQAFAESSTKVVWEIDVEKTDMNTDLKADEVPFNTALDEMVLEAQIFEAQNDLPDLKKNKWPHQPGISLEMIRHFEHDIAGKDVFTNLESFVKAAKYADRAFNFLIKELGDDATFDPLLKKMSAKLTKWKKSPKAQVEFIKLYFNKIGQPLPFEVDLDLNESGKSKVTLEENQKVIEIFWDHCRQAMWDGANQVLKKKTDDLKRRIDALGEDDLEESKSIYEDLVKLDEMLEIEDRILTDEVAGVHDLDPEYKSNIEEFRSARKEYKQKSAKFGHLEYIDPKLGKSYAWVEKMLEAGKVENVKMAAAALMSAPGKLNDALDYIDDGLMTTLRNGGGEEYVKVLREGQGLYWDEQVNQFLRGTPWEGRFDSQFQGYEKVYSQKIADISKWFNDNFESKLASRGLEMVRGVGGGAVGVVQTINTTFNESVSNSRAGGAMMTGMMIYNLKDELPLYWDYLMKDDWGGFAAEFFKRRVPFGGAVERGVMGDYYGVAWEVTSTLLPPAALVSATISVAKSLTLSGMDMYFDEALETFIDNLYESAKFKIVGVDKVGEGIKISRWRLLSVEYRGVKFDYDELIAKEIADAREMGECLKLDSEARIECFPMEKVSDGIFQWWDTEDAFEQQFIHADPWLQVLTEMKKNPIAGEKLKDHFDYQIYTRWEQVKVDFLKHMRKKLEERRAGEQALLSGKFMEMYDKLFEIAKDLDIHVQLQEAMDEEFGGGVWQFMTWAKDYLRGTVRQLKSEVDVWDVYEELSVFVTKNLNTYNKIADKRKEAEEILTYAHEDQGLRILTGPYFLTGKSEKDDSGSTRWYKLPTKVKNKMSRKMESIKKAAEARPPALDLEEGSYDKGVLDQLIYHESFIEMWIWVNGQFDPDRVASYLGQNPSTQDVPNGTEVMSDSDRAMQRFKFHTSRVDAILEEFKQHYEALKEQEEEEEEDEVEEPDMALLTQIQELEALARAVVDGMDADYETIKTEAKGVIKKSGGLVKALGKLEKLIDSVQKRAKTVDDQLALTQKDADQAQMQDDKAVINRGDVQDHALKCCEAAERVKQTIDVDELKRLIPDVRIENDQVRDAQQAFNENLSLARSASADATKIQKEMMALSGDLESVKSQFAEKESVLGDIQSDYGTLEGAAASMAGKAGSISGYKAQGEAIHNQVVATNEAKKAAKTITSEDKGLEKSIAGVLGKIKGHEKKAKKFDKKAKKEVSSVGTKLKNVSQRVEEVRERVNSLEATPQISDETMIQFLQYAKEAKVAFDSVEIFEDSVTSSAQQSAVCLQAAEEHFAWETSPEAQVAKKDCSPWPTTHAVWNASAQRADCECPVAGETYVADQQSCIDIRVHAVSQLDCSRYFNTHPDWNSHAGRAECFCNSNLKWNQQGTGCIQPAGGAGGGSQTRSDPMCPAYIYTIQKNLSSGDVNMAKTLAGTAKQAGCNDPVIDQALGGGGSSSGGGSGGSNVGCAPPGRYDSSCMSKCRCPDGSCEFLGQGCN